MDELFIDLDHTYVNYLRHEAELCEDPWPVYELIYSSYCQRFSKEYLKGCEWYNFINQFNSVKEAYIAANLLENKEMIEYVIGKCFVEGLNKC